MSIDKQINENKLTVQVEGKLDANTSNNFLEDVSSSLDNIKDLVIGFDSLDYISSAGLRSILSLVKVMNDKGSIKLINVSQKIMSIFEVTGFVDILDIECKW